MTGTGVEELTQARVWRGAGMEPSALSVSTSAYAPVVPGECRFLIVNVLNATELHTEKMIKNGQLYVFDILPQ